MKYLKALLIVSILVSLALFLSVIDFNQILIAVKGIGSKFIILLLVTFIASILGTLSWRACLGKQAEAISLGQLFLIRHLGEITSVFNPAGIVGGEALKVHLLCSSQQLDKKTVLATTLVSRAIMIFTQLTLFGVVALCLLIPGLNLATISLHWGLWLSVGASLLLIGLSCYFSSQIKSLFLNLSFGLAWKNKTAAARARLKELFASMFGLYHSNKKAALYASIYAWLHWMVGAMEFYLILTFLGIDVTVLQSILVDMGVIFFKTAGVFVPAQAGVEEYGNKIMLSVIGIRGAEIWITVSILRRARQLCWLAFGIVIYLCMYKTWTQRLAQSNGNIIR
jgi:uncharacterized protein (TIRG00374 family)